MVVLYVLQFTQFQITILFHFEIEVSLECVIRVLNSDDKYCTCCLCNKTVLVY